MGLKLRADGAPAPDYALQRLFIFKLCKETDFSDCICTCEENEGFQREHPFDAGFPIGARAALLAHDFAPQSLVCYTFVSG